MSDHSVEVSADGVVHDVSFRKYLSDKPTDGTGWLLDFKPAHWTEIAAHQSVVIPFTEPITDKLFKTSGLFSIEINFQVILKDTEQSSKLPSPIPSNQVFFIVADCDGESAPTAAPR